MTDLRDKIAAVLYSRAMSRLSWHRDWGDLQPDVQQMWLDDADAVIRELPELQQPVSISDYAAHLCQSGCDCSCCYGMDDCYHVTDPCNCGQAAKDHRHA